MVLHTPINNVGHRVHSGTDNIQQRYMYVHTRFDFSLYYIIFRICIHYIYLCADLYGETIV